MNSRKWVTQDPEIMNGAPIFAGTRIPVAVLFENLAEGLPLTEILDTYPAIPREAAVALLQEALRQISSDDGQPR